MRLYNISSTFAAYLQALVDDSIAGLMRSIGDAGAAPTNTTGATVLNRLADLWTELAAIEIQLNNEGFQFASDTDPALPNLGVLAIGLPFTENNLLGRLQWMCWSSGIGDVDIIHSDPMSGLTVNITTMVANVGQHGECPAIAGPVENVVLMYTNTSGGPVNITLMARLVS